MQVTQDDTTVFNIYLLHDAVHVVFVRHACQLQVDGNIFTDAGYGRNSLQQGGKYEIASVFVLDSLFLIHVITWVNYSEAQPLFSLLCR